MEELFPGVFRIGDRLATRNMVRGHSVYGEKLISIEGVEYRFWNPYRSKLAAAIIKGLKMMPISPGSAVLYLGAASGTTASHVSDIVGEGGRVYCVEFAPRVVRDLIALCEVRKNMFPIFADARKPEEYEDFVEEVDVIYEDVADPSQGEIMLKNAEMFLKKGGWGMIAIKSQSIDVGKKPSETYEEVLGMLRRKFKIHQTVNLEPFDKDHLFVLAQYR